MNRELAVNTTLSHYRIVSKLGAGGMGEVWLAEDTRLERRVALKLLPAEFTQDTDRVRRFMQEAKAASALNHPNIITVYDIGESAAGRFIVMELVAGRTLRSVIAQDNSLETLLALGSQMAKALSAAHAAGITHRDIKPDNIMVRDDGYLKVLDFGLARLLPTESGEDSATLAQQTTPGMIMGTVAYMSPEQASGESASPPSDVFALGIVLYELVTGQHPFGAETLVGYLHSITSLTPRSPRELRQGIPAALDELILRMLAKEAGQRPSAREVALGLQEVERRGDTETLRPDMDETVLLPTGVPGERANLKEEVLREARKVPQSPQRSISPQGPASSTAHSSSVDEGFWVAVLPFKSTGASEVATLAEGLTEDIITGLSRFSYLRVIARGSTLRYASQTTDMREVGKELGARYVMEGSLRQAGTVLRIAVQMVDASTGAHLWAENYSRTFSPEAGFELQDDLVPRIVSTVADWYGVLPHSMSEVVRLKSPDQLSPYEAVLRSFGYFERIAPEEHAAVRAGLERAVEQAPGNADGWAMLSMLYGEEHRFGFNVRPDPLERSLEAARRAVDAAHANHFAWLALGQALFFRKDFDGFHEAAERAIALNPLDGSTSEYLGHLIAFSGDWERGCDLAKRARQLNPNHPGWYWAVPFLDAYRKGDYRSARTYMLKVNQPGHFFSQALLAAVYGQLDEREAAEKTVNKVLTLKPDFALIVRNEFGKWYLPELVDQLIDGLRKAGLEIADEEKRADASVVRHSSGATRADEGFWVAVLPFKCSGASAELKTLAEGLSEEIVTGLSRFSYLRVIALSATSRHASDSSDVRSTGKELGARYVMEGSLRQAGMKLRLAVQLIDATTGAHLWAENYERSFTPEAGFELQDDLVPRIVSTVADQYGALVHSMSESLRGRGAGQYSAREAVLRAFGYSERITAEEHAEVREILEAAVAGAPPGHSDCQAMLSLIYWHEYAHGYNVRPDPLGRAHAAARQAVAAAPTNHLAHYALASVLFFQKDFPAFRPAAERALALNRMDASTTAFLGILIAYSGDWEYGLVVTERAIQLNPHHAGWYHFPAFYYAYHRRDYSGALEIALKINMPSYFFAHTALAAVYGQLSEQERANAALRELQKLVPDFGAIAREEYGKWFDAEVVEHLMDGLRKAGLQIADRKGASTSAPATQARALAEPSPSIAVLPFANLSPDSDNEFFADGLTEEVIADLSVIRTLRVISRTSAMHFKGTNKDLRAIARELDVRYLLEGSVRRAGASLRVTAQLIDAENDSHLWAEKYSGSIEDVFAIQEEISRKIVNALELRLTDAEARVISERPIDNAAAYDCYMRARHEVYLFTSEGLDRAKKLVDAGLTIIGENSLLLATRGMVSWYYLNFSIRSEERYLDEAAAYAARALEQDSKSYFGIFLRGLVAAKRGDIESAVRDLRTAHEQKPGDATVLNELIRHLFSAGQEQCESARPVFEESLRVDPLAPLNWAQAAWRHFSAGRLAEAVEAARRIFHLTDRGNPGRVYAAYYLALANVLEEAIAVFEAEGSALPGTAYGSVSLFLSRALQGDAEGAVTQVTPQLEQAASWTEYLALFLADGYALIGHLDAALRWLRTAVDQGFINYPYLVTRDPFLANVRSDPRFAELIRGVKARWEALSQNLRMPGQAQPRVVLHYVIPSPASSASAEADNALPEIESGDYKLVESRGDGEALLISPSHRSSVSPTLRHIVGRDLERNELRAAFNAAKTGRGSLLCVAGEPGIGKTTLVEDFLAKLSTENQYTIARGRCSERLAGTEAYLPLLEALESLRQSDDSIAQTMKQLAPTWYAQVVPLSGDNEESARLLAEVKAASQERMKRELASFLQSVAQTRPLVIFFDDLHWADISTIDLLNFLAGKFDVLNLLVVVTYRPSDMLLAKHSFLQIKPDLQARGVCRELVLDFLTEAEIAEYLALEFPDHRFPSEFQTLIHAKTEGSPLFMADLVRYLRDSSVIAIEDSGQDDCAPRWTLAQALPDIERELPESVRGMIERKIAQLEPEDHRLLTAASVQGYEFDSAVLGQVLKLDADEIEERLEKLERVYAVVKLASEAEFPNRTLTLKYRFVHVLYQNALYAGLRASRKAALSRDVAQALEGCYGARSASVANELALLWEAARDSARAADCFLQAARNSAQINAHREAAQFAEHGLEALRKLPETPERDGRELGLQLALGVSLMSVLSWGAPETGAAFNRARRLCEQMGDDPRLFAALSGVGAYHLMRAEYETARGLYEQMMQLAEQSQSPVLPVRVSISWAKVHYWQGDLVSAQQQGEHALALDRREYRKANPSVANEDLKINVRREHSYCLWMLGYADRALALAQEAVTLAEQLSHPFSLGGAHHGRGWILTYLRDWPSSQRECEKVLALAEEYALGDMLNYATATNALALAYQEPTEAALERAQQALASLRAKGLILGMTWYLAMLGEVFWLAGRRAEGLAAIAEALALVEHTGERVQEAEIWRIKGELLLKAAASNAQAEAESCYHQAIEIARQQRAKAWELRAAKSLARLWQQQGRHQEAWQMLAGIYAWFTEGFDTADMKDAKGLLDELSLSLKPQQIRSDKLQVVAVAEPDVVTQSSDKLKFVEPSPSIAVLPFANISNDPDNEYFCDGLAEELLNALSKIDALRVAARTSAFFFKGKETDIREIGRKLNVSTVLEGSVRKAGNRLRITAQLVNIADGYHLWSERYDREMKDIFDVQDEITLTVVGALKMKLLGEEKAAVLKHYTDNTEAYQLYLKGRYHANRFTREGFTKAIEYLNEAIEKDPHYALAYAGIADAYYHAATIHMPPGEAFLEVKAASAKALELDDALAEAHTLFAVFVDHYDRKPLEAESGFRRGIELAPNSVLPHQQYGLCLAKMGRFDEAIAELRRAQELDPLSLVTSFLKGWTYYFARQPEKAKEEARKALEIDESFWMAHWTLALGYEQTGQYDEALAELGRAKALDDSSWIPAVFARVYGRLGRKDEAQKILDELAEKSKQQWVAPYLLATAYVSLDRRNKAFEWLQKALEEYDEWIGCIAVDPALDPLRSDPRFQDLLRRVALPQ